MDGWLLLVDRVGDMKAVMMIFIIINNMNEWK